MLYMEVDDCLFERWKQPCSILAYPLCNDEVKDTSLLSDLYLTWPEVIFVPSWTLNSANNF